MLRVSDFTGIRNSSLPDACLRLRKTSTTGTVLFRPYHFALSVRSSLAQNFWQLSTRRKPGDRSGDRLLAADSHPSRTPPQRVGRRSKQYTQSSHARFIPSNHFNLQVVVHRSTQKKLALNCHLSAAQFLGKGTQRILEPR
jgi:hypothetical protein